MSETGTAWVIGLIIGGFIVALIACLWLSFEQMGQVQRLCIQSGMQWIQGNCLKAAA